MGTAGKGKRSCPDAETLSAYVDGDLEGDRRRALAEHLVHCVRCSRAAEELSIVRDQLSKLIPSSAEEPDFDRLWEGIVQRLQPGAGRQVGAVRPGSRTSRRWPLLAAAAAGLAVVAGVTFVVLRQDAALERTRAVPTPIVAEGGLVIQRELERRAPELELDDWLAETRLFLIEAALVCKMARTAAGCEDLRPRARALAGLGQAIATALDRGGAQLEAATVKDITVVLKGIAEKEPPAEAQAPEGGTFTETALATVFDINVLEMTRRDTGHDSEKTRR